MCTRGLEGSDITTLCIGVKGMSEFKRCLLSVVGKVYRILN